MNLYEITNAIANFEPEVDEETGELLNADLLDRLTMERDLKIESVALYIKNLDALANDIKAEKQNLDERMKSTERKRDSLKRYLASALAGEKFESAKCDIRFKKNPPSLCVTNEDKFNKWLNSVGKEYIRETIKREANKDAIKKAMQCGLSVDGAEITQSVSMQIK